MKLMKLTSISLALSGIFAANATANEQKTEKLDEIVVTAAGTSQALKDAPASISVINRQQLKQHPVNNLENALQDVPGVNVSGAVMQIAQIFPYAVYRPTTR